MPRKRPSWACRRCEAIGNWGAGGRYCFDCRARCADPNPHPAYKCNACKALKAIRYREDNPEYKEEMRKKRKMKLYNITRDDLIEIEKADACESCGDQAELCIDHDHETGRVRGMLCNPCNKALGFLREDPERMLSLIKYTKEKVYR